MNLSVIATGNIGAESRAEHADLISSPKSLTAAKCHQFVALATVSRSMPRVTGPNAVCTVASNICDRYISIKVQRIR